MDVQDRWLRGFIAGGLAGVVMNVVDQILFALNLGEIYLWEWASVLIYGYRTTDLSEILLALVIHVSFSAFLGMVFAYLTPKITSKNYLFKGVTYGLIVFFTSYAITQLFKVSPLVPIKGDTVIANMITASVWGLVLAIVLWWLDKRIKVR